jgi:hypothetical protein
MSNRSEDLAFSSKTGICAVMSARPSLIAPARWCLRSRPACVRRHQDRRRGDDKLMLWQASYCKNKTIGMARTRKPSQTSERMSQSISRIHSDASHADCSPGYVEIDRALSRSANSASRRRRGAVKPRCGSSIWICPRGNDIERGYLVDRPGPLNRKSRDNRN